MSEEAKTQECLESLVRVQRNARKGEAVAPADARFVLWLLDQRTDELVRAAAEREEWERIYEAYKSVVDGDSCIEEQAEGNGPCGICRNCYRALLREADGVLLKSHNILCDVDCNGSEWPGKVEPMIHELRALRERIGEGAK